MFEERAKSFVRNLKGRIGGLKEEYFLDKLKDEIELFRKNKDKIAHLKNIEKELKEEKEKHEKICPKEPGTCPTTRSYEKCLFFVQQELEAIVDEKLDKKYFLDQDQQFDKQEINTLSDKIDEALEQLKVLGYGQEVIFSEIEEMKVQSKKLTKKDFKLLFLGKLIAFGEKRLFGEETIREIFELANDSFPNLLEN